MDLPPGHGPRPSASKVYPVYSIRTTAKTGFDGPELDQWPLRAADLRPDHINDAGIAVVTAMN